MPLAESNASSPLFRDFLAVSDRARHLPARRLRTARGKSHQSGYAPGRAFALRQDLDRRIVAM